MSTSLRAVFADDDADINPIHGAASVEAAEKELHTFFPPQATIGVIKPDAYSVPEQRGMTISLSIIILVHSVGELAS